MIHAAHGSRLHSEATGTVENDAARRHATEARTICDTIDDAEDREVVLGDLATLPFDRDA